MKKVFISGNFNILHPGHIRLLRFAKSLGDKLIVGVFSDKFAEGEGRIIEENYRLAGIKSNNFVNEAYLIKQPLNKFLKKINPDVIVKGKEYENMYNIEEEYIKSKNNKPKLIFGSGEITFSSRDLIGSEITNSISKNYESNYSKDFLKRHKLSLQSLKKTIKKFNKLKVCVIGDIILDEYIVCQPIGMSQEDFSVVASPINSKLFLGGAGIVAAHSAKLGAETYHISLTGNDQESKTLENLLKVNGVKAILLKDNTRPTTVKKRYLSNLQSLFRLTNLSQQSTSKKIEEKIYNNFKKIVNKIDILIFSDFNYGVLSEDLIKRIIKLAKKRNILISADCQSSSQVGDISKYSGVDLITPTEREARLSIRNFNDGLIIMSEKLRKRTKVDNILLKLGDEGMLIHLKDEEQGYLNDRLPAINLNPVSISGAGDSALVSTSLSLYLTKNLWLSSFMGSLTAALQVGRAGNIPIKQKELAALVDSISKI